MADSSGLVLDIGRIMQLLPHRYPFLLVDRIIDVDGDQSAIGIKNVTINEPFFTGHFPENPVMPGVLIVEAMAQTAGAICIESTSTQSDVVYFMSIESAKFRRPVVPGDQLHIHVNKLKQRRNIWKFACEAQVDGQLVSEAIITAMMAANQETSAS
ncbi:MAG: 3-hydroxyacyl-ACP dehydratase FabZ [Rhizobiaceae bacterium]